MIWQSCLAGLVAFGCAVVMQAKPHLRDQPVFVRGQPFMVAEDIFREAGAGRPAQQYLPVDAITGFYFFVALSFVKRDQVL